MLHREEIRDFDDPRLAPFRTLRAQGDHLKGGVFVAEGEKVVDRLLQSRLEVQSILLPPRWAEVYEPRLAARPESITLFVADKETLMQLTGFSMYQGLLGLAKVPQPMETDAPAAGGPPRLWCALDGLSNAENVGAVVRASAALGVTAVVSGETSAHPYLRRAVRSSMGTVFAMPYLLAGNLAETLRRFRSRGMRCLAAHPRAGAKAVWNARLTGDVCLVFGSEGEGIRPEVAAACDEAVILPMAGGVDSLNVASAAAAILAEAARQRAFDAPDEGGSVLRTS